MNLYFVTPTFLAVEEEHSGHIPGLINKIKLSDGNKYSYTYMFKNKT